MTLRITSANDDMGVVLMSSFPRRVMVMGVTIDHQVYSAGKGIFAFAAAVHVNGNWAYFSPYYSLDELREGLFKLQQLPKREVVCHFDRYGRLCGTTKEVQR